MAANTYSITVGELLARGADDIPGELVSSKHLIYSSPATLSFNSPGAQGFGVKRAGLVVPGSVMLLVSPGCCGRNTTILGDEGGYSDRMFYLEMNESDIVTGRHLTKIPEAVGEICSVLSERPSVVMICITCVDALLGTDMERVCRRAEAETGIPVRACYMYALTREGVRPPMVSVRQSVYSLLTPAKKDPHAANILGFFAPLRENCELGELFNGVGITRVRSIGACGTYEEYLRMAEANFNLVLDQEARFAASDMEARLGIPYIELTRVYQADKVANQYRLLGKALGVEFDDAPYRAEAQDAIDAFRAECGGITLSVGEAANGDPFEMSLALLRYGCGVAEIFGTVGTDTFRTLRAIAKLSPDTKIYSNMSPSMLSYDGTNQHADVVVGRDAAYYHPNTPCAAWNSERQPFGYRGLADFLKSISAALGGSHAEVTR